jgi:copper transport protein
MPNLDRLRRLATIAAVALVAVFVLPAAAQAHSFLIRSQPEAGARLAKAPATMQLYFSEAFVRGSEQVTIRRPDGEQIKLATATIQGAMIAQPLPRNLRGVFIVSWRVLSDDGHISLGEFAFAAGSAAALPTTSNGGAGTSWSEVAASWLVFIGLALALGGLLSERIVWRRRSADGLAAAPVAIGVAAAVVGALVELVLLAGNQRGGGFLAGLHGRALGDVLGTRPGKLTLTLLVALAVAAVLLPLRRLRLAAILPLLVAVIAIAARGHSGTSGTSWAVVADALHLAAVAVWLGALVHLVLIVARAPDTRPALVESTRRYSRLALPTVLVALASGVLTAIPEFRSVSAVVSSGYGQTLLIKAALIGVALLAALTARQRALSGNPTLRLPLLRRLTLIEASTLAIVLVVAAVLVNAAPPRAPAAAQAAAVLGPPPVAGPAVQLAELAGQLVVGLTAGERELQFTVVPPGTQPPGKLTLTADARRPDGSAVDLFPRSCGATCFSIQFSLHPGVTTVSADISSSLWKGGQVRFAVPWPLPAEQPALVTRIAKAMRAVPKLAVTETVTSGPAGGAPAATYALSGRQFMQTEVFAGGAVDVRPLGHSGGLTEVAFAFPGSQIWYRVWIDRQYRLHRELILDPGHRIARTFDYGPRARASAPSPAAPSTVSPTGGVVAPPPGSLVLGQEDGDLAVGLAVHPGPTLGLQATILGPDGGGLSGLNLVFVLKTSTGSHRALGLDCGSGCYRASAATTGRPEAVTLRISGAGRPPSTLTFTLPSWPAPAASKLLAAATRVFHQLRTLTTYERLASSPTNVVDTIYQAVAPDRLSYKIAGGGPQAVIIGNKRWDRNHGVGKWQLSAQSPLRQPTPFWTSATDAHLLGRTTINGQAASLISFYDAKTPGFFTIAVDKANLHTLDLHMTAAAHFMHHRYSGFNAPIQITPPR